jgi:cytochrome c553
LEETRVLAEGGRWSAAADALAHACDVLPLAIHAGQLLDQMVLVDYHPLRVRLRDGSGAQSRAARALGPAVHAAAGALWTALERDGLRVLDVLQRPNEHLEPYRFLTRLKLAGKLLQSFLFHHYTLVLGVLGTHSLGSLGYEMRELADYFAKQKPLQQAFKVDAAKARLGRAKAEETLCTMCHLGGFAGQNEIPRVAGQQYTYIVKQLSDFKARKRTNDAGNMTSVASTLSAEDIENLAHYLVGL